MEEIDIDNLLGDEPVTPPSYGEQASKPSYEEKKPYNNYNKNEKSDKINMYDVEFIKPKEIDTDTFNKAGRSFMVHTYNAPDDVIEKIVKVATKLIKDGFLFRHDGASDDEAQNKVLSLCTEAGQCESYIPFKKFNENIEKPITPNAFELPFQYAAHLFGQSYNDKLGKGAKACYASKVHALLGKDSTNPIDFLLCYNVNGDEVYPPYKKGGPKIDYTKLGSLGFYLRVTDKVSIPVYNFKNPESIKNLVELIK